MTDSKSLALIAQPDEFFRELVTEALSNQKLHVQPETEVYLVSLLGRFISTENLYPMDAKGNLQDEPLALRVKEAFEEEKRELQSLLFRNLGDISLYVGGYFQESLNRKLVDLGYYIDVGVAAYGQVAVRSESDHARAMFEELSDQFEKLVRILSEVSLKTTPTGTEREIFRLYETWVSTKSDRAAKALEKAGIKPRKPDDECH